MALPNSTEWLATAKKEHQSFIELNVLQLVSPDDVPPGQNIIGLFKVETDRQFKGRVVTTGWSQRHGIDCGSTFAPVCCIESQWLQLAIAPANGWSVVAMDVLTAFLNGELSGEIYKRQAQGFATKNSRGRPFILKLRRSI